MKVKMAYNEADTSAKLKEKDKEPIKIFMKMFKSNHGIIVSRDVFNYADNILIIPAWMFLLII